MIDGVEDPIKHFLFDVYIMEANSPLSLLLTGCSRFRKGFQSVLGAVICWDRAGPEETQKTPIQSKVRDLVKIWTLSTSLHSAVTFLKQVLQKTHSKPNTFRKEFYNLSLFEKKNGVAFKLKLAKQKDKYRQKHDGSSLGPCHSLFNSRAHLWAAVSNYQMEQTFREKSTRSLISLP